MAGKKITELSSGSLGNLPLSGTTAVVYSGVTFQHNLSDLRNVLVDSGSHHFTGSQTISGDLTVSGSITAHEYILSSSITNVEIQSVSGSSFFGNDSGDTHNFIGSVSITGSLDVSENTVTSGFGHIKQHLTIGPSLIHHTGSEYEALHASTTSSINIAHFEGDTEYYSQINVKNVNSGNNSSTDIVATADNGTETNHFVNMGINSSTYNGGFVGRENDAYLLNVGKDLYIGTVGGSEHPSKLFLFGQNSWEDPQVTISGSGQVSFNTCSCDPGYTYQFSGSAKFQNDVTVVGSVTSSYFTGSFVGDGSGLYNLPVQTTDVSMFLSSSAFETFTSSYITESSSFDSRILAATNEQDLSNLATTGSNTFIGDQVITGLVNIDGSLRTNDYKISLGSNTQVGGYAVAIGANTQADSYSVSIGAFAAKKNVTNSTSYTVAIGAFSQQNANDGDQTGTGAIAIGVLAGDSNQGTNAVALGRYAGRDNQASRSIVINATGGDLNNTTSDSLVIKPIRNNDGPSILMYDSVSGEITHTLNNTLATTGSNTFIGDQVVSGSLDISGSATLNNNNIVSSNTIEKIETITSASYALITPISGTLYIIID